MVYEAREQSMAWMENRVLKTYNLSMEDKMAAGAFWRARNYGQDGPLFLIRFNKWRHKF